MYIPVVAGERHLYMSNGADKVTLLSRHRPDGALYIGPVPIASFNGGGNATTLGGGALVAVKALLPIFLQDGASTGNTICSAADSPAEITADQNNFNLGNSRFIRLTTDATPRRITGFTNATGIFNADGEEHLVYVLAGEIIVPNDDSGSTAANRCLTPHGGDLRITAGEVLRLMYDATSTRWRASTTGDTQSVVAKDDDYTVVATDHGTIFTNTGASATVLFTLPASASCVAGKTRFRFFADIAQIIQIQPAGSDDLHVFSDGSSNHAENGVPIFTAGSRGNCIEVFYIGGGQWGSLASSGWAK